MIVFVVYFVLNASANASYSLIKKYEIIIYGGGPQAVAAALHASQVTNDHSRILMIVPETKLGSTLTAGAQNIFDQVSYHSSKLPAGLPANYPYPQGGTNFILEQQYPRSFNPEQLAKYLSELVSRHPNITVHLQSDISDVKVHGSFIQSVTFKKLIKGDNGRLLFASDGALTAYAPIFLDASETGRLVRLSHFEGTVGREDQDGDPTQMNASLMFKVKNVDVEQVMRSPFAFLSSKGYLQFWGGGTEVAQDPIAKFNQSNPNFYIKPFNAASDSVENTQFWLNLLLIYNVDARKAWRDQVEDNGYYPSGEGLDPEAAKEMAVKELQTPAFLEALHSFKGLEHAQLVMEDGKPAVGEILYMRESIHAYHKDHTFALNKATLWNDQQNFDQRIGLGYYQFDTNGYKTKRNLANPIHPHPWYVPYGVLTTSTVRNLLIPGYAASIDSFTWSAMRVYPNLMVLGDAAGTAAGLASQGRFTLSAPNEQEIKLLQSELASMQVILDK